MKNAMILCSGGLDSVVTAHFVKKKLKYENIEIIFFNYGQRSIKKERIASKKCSRDIGAKFREIRLDYLKEMLRCSLMGNIKNESKSDLENGLSDTKKESDKWYVPCRNMIFAVNCFSISEARSANGEKWDLFVGFKNEGKEPFPDTTAKFVNRINSLNAIASKSKSRLFAPMIRKDKEDIIKIGRKLDVDLALTYSCYESKKEHCGKCLACRLRKSGFYWAGINDPTKYLSN